jgi:agmatine deiminase
MPAEWEPHAATWVAWPTSADDWPGCLDRAEAEFVGLARALAESEITHVLAPEAACARSALTSLAAHPRIRTHAVETVEAFLRDTGPTFVAADDGGLVAIDWTFNAWGGRYDDSRRDDAVARIVASLAGVPALRSDLVTEGGALEVDGEGTLLAVEGTLLDPARNPAATRAGLESRFASLLGISKVIWLDASIEGDDTGGHVDTLARFVAPGRVAGLPECRARLGAARDARGRPLEVVDLPMPPAAADRGGGTTPAGELRELLHLQPLDPRAPVRGADGPGGGRGARLALPRSQAGRRPVPNAAPGSRIGSLLDAAAARPLRALTRRAAQASPDVRAGELCSPITRQDS